MSLKLKLTIAAAGSLVLLAGLCLLFLKGRGSVERPAAPKPNRPAVVARAPVAAKKSTPKAVKPAEVRPPAVKLAPARGGWRIAGRIVRAAPDAGLVAPVENVTVHLRTQPRRTKSGEGPSRKAVTGPDGRFDFEHVPGGNWMRIEIDEPSSAHRSLSFQLDDPRGAASRDLGDIHLEAATRLTVRLLGPTGEPASAGRVLVGSSSPMLAILGVTESRLEAAEKEPGTYVLERASPGSHYVQAIAPGCSEGRENVDLPRKEALIMRLPEGRKITGKVLTVEGAAIAKAELEILSGPGARELAPRTTTDAEGRFGFDTLAQGDFVIGITADGFADARLRNIASGTEDLEVLLEAEAVFSGKVVGEADGKPVDKVEVTLREQEGQTFSGASDRNGVFRVSGMRAGTYTLTAKHPDFAPASEGPIEVGPAERVEGHVIRLSKGVAAAGKVVDAESAKPVGDADVSFIAKGRQGGTKDAHTDAEGAFEVKGLAEGKFEVRATARGYLHGKPQTVEVAAGGTSGLVITLERGGSISGRVLGPGGKAVAGALVQPSISFTTSEEWNEASENIADVSLRTDSEGQYRLEGLPAHRSYLVRASSANFAPASSEAISVGRRQDVRDVDVTLTPGATIRGRVADAKGKPIRGAKVQAEEETEDEQAIVYTSSDAIGKYATTDVEGKYALSPLKAGVYKVRSRAKGHGPSTREKIDVAEGSTVEGIDFTLDDGEELAGRVLDTDGNPIASADVSVQGLAQAKARTDSEGRFRIGGLEAGDVTLHVFKGGFKEAEIKSAVPGVEVTVELLRLAKITGKLEAGDVNPLPSFQVIAVPQEGDRPASPFVGKPAHSDPAGRFEVEVEAGTYVLQATGPGFAPSRSRPVTVKAGDRQEEVTIELLPGGTLNGVVVARGTGAPIAGARVMARGDEIQPWQGFASATAKTGPDGSFSLGGVPEKIALTARHEKYAQVVIADVSVPSGGSASVRVEMSAGGGLRGTVSHGGAPVAGAKVHVSKQGTIESFGKETTTDSAGRFELERIPAGEYLLAVSGRDVSCWRTVVVVDGEMTEVDITVGVGLRLFGRVTSGGVPVTGGSITALAGGGTGGGQSPIDPSGRYAVELPAAGTYRIIIQTGTGGGASGVRRDVTVPEGVTEHRQDFDVASGGPSGIVVDAETRQPIPGAKVIAYASQPGPVRYLALGANMRGWAQADNSGRFHIPSLEPGRYSLRAAAHGYADGGVDGVQVSGEEGAPEIQIALERGVDFGARIVDERGQPVAQAAALLRGGDGDVARAGEPARSREDGWLELSGFRPGAYWITVVHPAYAPSRVQVQAASGAEPTITLRPGGQLIVGVASRRGGPVEGATIELLDEKGEDILEALLFLSLVGGGAPLQTNAAGALILEQVPAGAHRIVARKGTTRSRQQRVQVREGEITEVRLTFE